jgi:hypothetical protein
MFSAAQKSGSVKKVSKYIAIGRSGLNTPNVYNWSASGFGSKIADPASAIAGGNYQFAFSPNGNYVAIGSTGIPYITAYPWSSSGFGTRYSDPSPSVTAQGASAIGVALTFSPASDAIAMAIASFSPDTFVNVYAWSSSGFGSKYSSPSSSLLGDGRGVAFSPSGDAIAVSHGSSPYISVYPWSSATGFGTKYSNPSSSPGSAGNNVTFSPSGDAIAVTTSSSPYISAYQWSSASGFGTKYSDPSTIPGAAGGGVAFSPLGNAIAVAGGGQPPYILAYPWTYSSGFGTKYTNPPESYNALSVAFNASGTALAVGINSSPGVYVYPWSSSGFGTKYSDPSPTMSAGNSVNFG